MNATATAPAGSAGSASGAPRGYWQLVEGHEGGFMFTLRAGNHETILESRVFWSRQAALDGVARVRQLAQDGSAFARHESPEGMHWFELLDAAGAVLARSVGCGTRAGVVNGIASVRRNAPSQAFRGLVRRSLLVPG